MTISIKHKFTSPKADGPDATRVRPSNWNDVHDMIMATNRLLGRTTAAAGTVEEISVGSNLSLSAGALDVASAFATRVTTLENTLVSWNTSGFPMLDTNASHNVLLKAGSDVTATRTITFLTGDQNRTVDLTAGITQAYQYVGTFTATGAASLVLTTPFAVGFDVYKFVIRSLLSSTSAGFLTTVSENGGFSYIGGTSYAYGYGPPVSSSAAATSTAASSLLISGNINTTPQLMGELIMFRNSTTQTCFFFSGWHQSTNQPHMATGSVTTTAKPDAIKFAPGAGTITMTVEVYRLATS